MFEFCRAIKWLCLNQLNTTVLSSDSVLSTPVIISLTLSTIYKLVFSYLLSLLLSKVTAIIKTQILLISMISKRSQIKILQLILRAQRNQFYCTSSCFCLEHYYMLCIKTFWKLFSSIVRFIYNNWQRFNKSIQKLDYLKLNKINFQGRRNKFPSHENIFAFSM